MFKLIFGLLFFIVIGAIVLKAITPRKRKTPIAHSRRPMVNSSFQPTPSRPSMNDLPPSARAVKPTPAARPSVSNGTVTSASNSIVDDNALLVQTTVTMPTGYVPMSEPKSKPTINLGCAPDYNNDDSRHNHNHTNYSNYHTSHSCHSSHDSYSSSDSSSSSNSSDSSSSFD